PADDAFDLGDVGDAAAHVLEARLISLVVRNHHNLGRTASLRAYPLRQLVDGDLLVTADVEYLAHRLRRFGQPDDGLHHVVDVAKAALLCSIAVDLYRFALECPLHKARQHHPVVSALARTDGVEQAEDDDGQISRFVIGQRQKFVQFLRGSIAPAALGGRAERAVIVFVKGDFFVLAVYLGGRGNQHLFAVAPRRSQHHLCAADIDLDGVNGRTDNRKDAHRRRQVVDHVTLADQSIHDRRVADVFDGEMETDALFKVRDVFKLPGGQVVDDGHFLSP